MSTATAPPAPDDPAAQPTAPTPRRARTWPGLLIGALVGALLGVFLGPGLSPPTTSTGDPGLTSRVQQHLAGSRGFGSLSVVELERGGVRRADLGPVGRHHELGSVTKTFNGHLLADAVKRGEVALDDPVAKHLPELAGTPAGEVSLAELASHRGGLPRMLLSEAFGGLLHPLTMQSPYHSTATGLIAEVGRTPLNGRGKVAYSNVGASLLGHALARAAHQPDWPTLVRVRIFEPLGMRDTVIATRPEQVPASRTVGRTDNGGTPEPWTAEGTAPAGSSTWTTTEDLTRYAQALLNGTVPGMEALDPRWPAGSESRRIGLHWFTTSRDGAAVVWHNGGTGGGTSYLGLDRQQGRAVLILNDSTTDVTGIGTGLLRGNPPAGHGIPWMNLLVLVLYAAAVAQLAFRAIRPSSRMSVLSASLDALSMALLAWRLGPWQLLPGAVFGLLTGAAVAAWLLALRRTRGAPWTGRNPVLGWLGLGISAAICLLLVVLVGWGLVG
ncbi:beta-lactamase family protein [Naumannella sp. ID2617S]|nr:beta-lactamase family protein [Naumannella sp. ID2617S]